MATLFSGGLIFDGNVLLEGHAVLVENGIVSRCAPVSEFAGFDGVLVDTSGNTLLPGLFDCHVHLVFSGSADPFQELKNFRQERSQSRRSKMLRLIYLEGLPLYETVAERTISSLLYEIPVMQEKLSDQQ